MAAGASGIRAGKAYVEVGAALGPLKAGLSKSSAMIKAWGAGVQSVGKKLLALGSLAGTPFAASARAFTSYEDALASLRSAANPTAADLEKIQAAVVEISKATGIGPAKVAAGMTELLKAGLSLEKVLGGAAVAALQFAKVAEMEVPQAATVLTDAMNVFGVEATTAVDTLSRAADASSISVQDVALAFSAVGAVAKQAGLSIGDTANAIAILGQNGVKGQDAGTSLKSMLLRLQTGAESAGKTMAELGIRVRNADGSMKDMRGIVGELQSKLGGLSAEARDQAMLKLFGTDAIRAGAIFFKTGVQGWDKFTGKMQEGLSVAKKFEMLMDTLTGLIERGRSALERLGIEIEKALGPALRTLGADFTANIDKLSEWARNNQGMIVSLAKLAVGATAGGAALLVLGHALSGLGAVLGMAAAAVGVVASALTFLATPLGLVVAGLAAGAAAWLTYSTTGQSAVAALGDGFETLRKDAETAFGGIAAALKKGDIALAGKILWAALKLEWLKGIGELKKLWADWGVATRQGFADVSFDLARLMTDAWADIRKIWALGIGDLGPLWAGLIKNMVAAFLPLEDLLLKVFGVDINKAIDDATKALDAGPGDRVARLNRIEADRKAAQAGIDDQQAKDRAKRAADAAAAVKDNLDAQKKAQAELDALLTPDGSAPRGNTPAAGGGVGGPGGKKDEGPGDIGAGLAAAAGKISTAGTFNASNLAGLGAGDSVSDKQLDVLKEIHQEQKKQTKAQKQRTTFVA